MKKPSIPYCDELLKAMSHLADKGQYKFKEWSTEQAYIYFMGYLLGSGKLKWEGRHNGEAEKEFTTCDRDYLHGKAAAYHLPDCTYYLTGRKHHSGGNVVYQVTELSGRRLICLLPCPTL